MAKDDKKKDRPSLGRGLAERAARRLEQRGDQIDKASGFDRSSAKQNSGDKSDEKSSKNWKGVPYR